MSDNESSKKTADKSADDNKKVTSKSKAVNIVLTIVVVALTGCIVFMLFHKDNGDSAEDEVKRRNVVNNDNVEDIVANLNQEEQVPMGSYTVTMNSTWKFENGKSASYNAYVENVQNNTNAVYFDVIRSDTGETIYESPILPLGSYIDNIKLDTELPAGTYDCVLIYSLVDDNQETVSNLRMALTIIVEN